MKLITTVTILIDGVYTMFGNAMFHYSVIWASK